MPSKKPKPRSPRAPVDSRPRRPSPRGSPPAAPTVASAARSAHVVLDLEHERGRLHIVLANCGNGVATDVRIEFSRPLVGPDDIPALSELPLFQRLGVLRPGVVLRVFWGIAGTVLNRDHTPAFSAAVAWTDSDGSRHTAVYHHDPAIFRDWPACD